MGRRVILDTNALLDYEQGVLDRSALDEDEVAIAAITSAVEVLDCTEATAVLHARLIAEVRRSGKPRRAHDLIIAAHAAQTGRVLLSKDAAARFGDLPGVTTAVP